MNYQLLTKLILAIGLIMYLLGSLVAASFNIVEWSQNLRAFIAAFFAMSMLITILSQTILP